MTHWYAYHSVEAMGNPYPEKSFGYFLSKFNKKLCFGDLIWVVEGDVSKPRKFYLVDCFFYSENIFQAHSKFSVKISGEKSLLSSRVELSKIDPWFSKLHANYITKQKFFSPFEDVSEIVGGFKKLNSV